MAAPKGDDRQCGVCKRPVQEHSGKMCEACFHPIEHHDKAAADACWAGAARMADARRRAGLPLSDKDRKALRLFPDPPTLRLGGYA